MSKLLVMTVVALCLVSCWGYPSGAPASSCAAMTPDHGTTATANLGTSYSITASKATYAPGNKITVTISGIGGITFRGFLVEMRNNVTSVGTWTATTGGQLACTNAGVTHITNNDKTSVTMDWTAPSTSAGTVQVRVTIVQSFSVWKTIQGPLISVASVSTTITTPKAATTTPKTATTTRKVTATTLKAATTPKVATTTRKVTATTPKAATTKTATTKTTSKSPLTPIDATACGKTKGCFKSIPTCTTSCEYLLMWQPVGDEIQFQMSGNTSGYIAVGFSKDQGMGDDNVVLCTNDGVFNMYQSGRVEPESINENNPHFGLTSFVVKSDGNGRVSCSFSRKKTFATNPARVFDLTNSYYILLARGILESGEPEKHTKIPAISQNKVDFSKLTLEGNIAG